MLSNTVSVHSIVDVFDEDFLASSPFNPRNVELRKGARVSQRASFQPSFARVNSMGYRGRRIVESASNTAPVSVMALDPPVVPQRQVLEADNPFGGAKNTPPPPNQVGTRKKKLDSTRLSLVIRDSKVWYSSSSADADNVTTCIRRPSSATEAGHTTKNSQPSLSLSTHNRRSGPASEPTLFTDVNLGKPFVPKVQSDHCIERRPTNHGASAALSLMDVVSVKDTEEFKAGHDSLGKPFGASFARLDDRRSRKASVHLVGQHEDAIPLPKSAAHLNDAEQVKIIRASPASDGGGPIPQHTSPARATSESRKGDSISAPTAKACSVKERSVTKGDCDVLSSQMRSQERNIEEETNAFLSLVSSDRTANIPTTSLASLYGTSPTPATIARKAKIATNGRSAQLRHIVNESRRSVGPLRQSPASRHTGESSSTSKNPFPTSSAPELKNITSPANSSPPATQDLPGAPARATAVTTNTLQPTLAIEISGEPPKGHPGTTRGRFPMSVAPAKIPEQHRAQAFTGRLQQGRHYRINLTKVNAEFLHRSKTTGDKLPSLAPTQASVGDSVRRMYETPPPSQWGEN